MTNIAANTGALLERKNLIKQIAERHEANNRAANSFSPAAWNRGTSTMECFFTSEYDSAIKHEHNKLVGPAITIVIPHDPDADISDDL